MRTRRWVGNDALDENGRFVDGVRKLGEAPLVHLVWRERRGKERRHPSACGGPHGRNVLLQKRSFGNHLFQDDRVLELIVAERNVALLHGQSWVPRGQTLRLSYRKRNVLTGERAILVPGKRRAP